MVTKNEVEQAQPEDLDKASHEFANRILTIWCVGFPTGVILVFVFLLVEQFYRPFFVFTHISGDNYLAAAGILAAIVIAVQVAVRSHSNQSSFAEDWGRQEILAIFALILTLLVWTFGVFGAYEASGIDGTTSGFEFTKFFGALLLSGCLAMISADASTASKDDMRVVAYRNEQYVQKLKKKLSRLEAVSNEGSSEDGKKSSKDKDASLQDPPVLHRPNFSDWIWILLPIITAAVIVICEVIFFMNNLLLLILGFVVVLITTLLTAIVFRYFFVLGRWKLAFFMLVLASVILLPIYYVFAIELAIDGASDEMSFHPILQIVFVLIVMLASAISGLFLFQKKESYTGWLRMVTIFYHRKQVDAAQRQYDRLAQSSELSNK